MKNILLIIATATSYMTFSQVIIGNNTGTAANKTSVLLEFAAGQNKGLILPYIRTVPTTGLSEGTIILDASTATAARVRYYNGSWVDLNGGNTADISTALAIQPSGVTEDNNAKIIIGANTTTADGVLVLESTTQAMILPIVANTNDIPDPAPGMMVYINKSGAKRLAVFNGGGWTYWKP